MVTGVTRDNVISDGLLSLGELAAPDPGRRAGFVSSVVCARLKLAGKSGSETGRTEVRNTGTGGRAHPQLAGVVVSSKLSLPERKTTCSVGFTW